MARKYKRPTNRRYKLWSNVALKQAGPRQTLALASTQSPIADARRAVHSIAREEEIPQLREKNHIFSARAEKHDTYVRLWKTDRYRGMDAYSQILLLDMLPRYRLKLLFQAHRWAFVKEDYQHGVKHISIVYGSREHAMLALQNDRVCWQKKVSISRTQVEI